MKENKSYTSLDVWENSRELIKKIYLLTNNLAKEELYSLTSQMRRAAVSIPSNIAEGIARNYQKETIQFLHISKGYLYELETQLYLAFDIGYVKENEMTLVMDQIESCKKLVAGFINYYRIKLLKSIRYSENQALSTMHQAQKI
jgi:four helix bundle protein